MNDVRLNRRFVETDDEEEAYRLLFNAYYETVFNTVKTRRWNHPDTIVDPDEITSDTFIKTVKKRKEIQESEKLSVGNQLRNLATVASSPKRYRLDRNCI